MAPKKSYRPRRRKKVATVATVRRLIRNVQEVKYHTSTFTTTSVSSVGSVTDLSAISQGDTDNTRDGDQLKLVNFRMRGSFEGSDTTNILRVVIFQWKPSTTPSKSDILYNPDDGAMDVHRMYNVDKSHMYRIISDRRYSLTTSDTGVKTFTTSGRPPIKTIQYTAGTTTGTNKIYVLLVSDSTAVTHPTFSAVMRSRYTDS